MRASKWTWIGMLAAALTGASCVQVLGLDADYETRGTGGTTTGSGGTSGGGTTMTSTAGTSGSGGTGGVMPECTKPADCPPTGSGCIAATCDDGKCGTTEIEAGMPSTMQTAGDCKLAVCDRSGGIVLQTDDTDPFDDGQDCTIDLCDAGTPQTDFQAAGTACDDGGGKMCDGEGGCVECIADVHCADPTKPVCQVGTCISAQCADGTKNGIETDVDCGGAGCPKCPADKACTVAIDCQSGVCTDLVCQPPLCNDEVKNGSESDTDCGGPFCAKCPDLKSCQAGNDCQSGVCTGLVCQPPACNDQVKNGTEGDVDCGALCPLKCAVGQPCFDHAGCQSSVCTGGICQAPTCIDFVKNGTETDVDCGPANCPKCGNLKTCAVDANCQSGVCIGSICQTPDCNDGVKNGTETDVDCGGPTCVKCMDLKACSVPADCQSGVCTGNVCQPASCGDGVKNGTETDVDCGGPVCAVCATNKSCNVHVDCQSNVCIGGLCKAPLCNDGVKNGFETDVDCGGVTCMKCPPNASCLVPADCLSAICLGGVCGNLKSVGTVCGAGSECAGGHCVDGFCCSSACTGVCLACSNVKTGAADGACASVTANTDPDMECATECNGAPGASSACELDNGAACPNNGAYCKSGFCSDGFCCNNACNATCQACAASLTGGVNGTCSNILTGQDDTSATVTCAGTTQSCAGGACKSEVGQSCGVGGDCLSGFCVDNVCCSSTCNGTCQACSNTKTGLANGTCGSITANTDPDNECTGNGGNDVCNGLPSPACKEINGTACAAGTECLSGICIDNVCCNAACSGTCQACNLAGSIGTCTSIPLGQDPANECTGNGGADVCNGAGACKEVNGSACAAGSECASGFCVEGVCCNAACTGDCQSCLAANTPSANGTCDFVDVNTDPQADCTGAQVCSMMGTCVQGQNGATCPANGADANCGSGFCADGVCCNSACGGTCQACTTMKKGSGANGTCGNIAVNTDPDSECLGLASCNGSGLCQAQAQGGACMSNSECSGGNCVDGFCCNNACTGACVACSNAKTGGTNGTCANIPVNTDPDNECLDAANCTGTGICQAQAQGGACMSNSECTSGFCVDNFCCNTTCGGLCQACSMVLTGGANGACLPVLSGLETGNECSSASTCNGMGACN